MNLEIFIILGVTLLSTLLVYIAQSNLRNLKRLKIIPDQKEVDLVSILIPARNEYHNIRRCLDSLIKIDYSQLEILVLNDRSTDQTATLVEDYQTKDNRIKLLQGEELPSGWIGKHWACHQLSSIASGDLLLFVDADTVLGSQVIENAVAEVEKDKIDLLTLLPNRLRQSFVDKLIYPFIDWSILCFLPVKLAHVWKNPYLSFTFGQFMLFRKSAYLQIGGYEAIHNNILDDMELGRRIKRNKLKLLI